MANTCSLTPPVSPLNHYKAANAVWKAKKVENCIKVPYFSCGTNTVDTFACSTESYLQSKDLKKLLDNDLKFDENCFPILLYGKIFSADTALFTNMTHLFACTRKQFHLMKMSSFTHSQEVQDKNVTCSKLRHEVCEFLMFLKVFLQKLYFRFTNKCELKCDFSALAFQLKKFLPELVKELKRLLLFSGRITADLFYASSVKIDSNRHSKSSYQYSHLCLDLWWSTLEILHIIHGLCIEINFELNIKISTNVIQDSKNLFVQVAFLIIWDLCALALNCYRNLESYFNTTSPFPCACIHEFWILLITLLDKRHDIFKENSFWVYLYQIMQYLGQNKNENINMDEIESFCMQNKTLDCEAPDEFCLWLISHLAPLYKFDINGQCTHSKKLESCYFIVKYLVESALTGNFEVRNEKHLRCVLSFIVPLAKLWEPSGEVLLPITDFYIKRIDDMFCLPGIEVIGLPYLFKTSSSWLELVKSVVSGTSNFGLQESSFILYLRVLALQINRGGTESNLWRQLKGRICSKFTPKRLRDLSEAGLQNCFSIFLIIACATHLEEVASKICELANAIQNIPGNKKKQMIAWKALFVLMSIYQQQDKKIDKIASKAVQLFDATCTDYSIVSRDSMQQNHLMDLLMVYTDNVKCMFKCSLNLTLSEYLLIGSGFSVLLPACSNELNYLLGVLFSILKRFYSVVEKCEAINNDDESDHRLLLNCLLRHFFPFVENHVLSGTPPNQLAHIAALFTILSYKFSISNVTSHNYIRLFKYFGNGESTNPVIMCSYLNFVLNDTCITQALKTNMPDFCMLLVQSFLKCSISLTPPCSEMLDVTKLVLRQQEIEEMFPGVKNVTFNYGEHDFFCIKFFRIIGESYESKDLTLQDRNFMREKVQLYFRNFVPSVATKVRQCTINSSVNHVYNLSGHLIEYCAPLLHTRFSHDTILPNLLDTLLFPHLTFPKDKELPTSLSRSIKEHLPLFLKGLAKLDYKSDAYTKRKFKDIIVHYLHHIPLANNPLVDIGLDAAFEKTKTLNFDLFQFIIEVIKKEFMANITSQSLCGFQYCAEIFKNIPLSAKKKLCDLLLKDLLFLWLNCEDTFLHIVRDLTNSLYLFLKKETDLTYKRGFLIPIFENFVKCKMAWCQYKVFRVLENTTEHFPIVMSDMIPFLTKFVECLEGRRGSGLDETLRKELKNISDKVQRALTSNKRKLC